MIINNIEFARKALEIHDIITISQLTRLSDILISGDGSLNYSLAGILGDGDKPGLRLKVQGPIKLRCQRCLEPMTLELDVVADYVIVPDESARPAEEDDQDYLVADMQMNVVDLIEDEVLLALPLAPKHADENCAASGLLDGLKKPSPFAALRDIKLETKG